MRSLIYAAEVTLGPEQIVGGGVFGLLSIVLAQLMRRQKDTDERRDAITKLAFDREARAAAERDEAMDELLTARVQCADCKARLAAAEYELKTLRKRLDNADEQ